MSVGGPPSILSGAPPPRREARLVDGPVGRTLFNLSWPMTIGLFATISVNVVDTFYIGQLGAPQLAAMGFCFPVIFATSALAIGLGIGAGSLVGRAIGAGDTDRVRRISTNALILATLLVAVVSAIGHATLEPLFRLLGATSDLIPYIRAYMSVWYWGIILLVAPIVANGLIRATGEAMLPSAVMVGMAIANAAISPLLVFGLLGFPELGMAGAAYGSLIARGLGFVSMIALLHYRVQMIEWSLGVLREFRKDALSILVIGAPAAASQAIAPISTAFLTHLLSGYGANTVAAFAVGARIEALFLIPFWSLQTGVNPFVGQNFGAGRWERLRAAAHRTWGFCIAWGLASFALLALFGGAISGLFTEDANIAALSARYLLYVSGGFIGAGAMLVAVAFFNPLAQPLKATAVTALRFLGLYLPLGVAFAQLGGAQGVFVAASASYIIAGAGAAWLLARALKAAPESAARAPLPPGPPPRPHPASAQAAPSESPAAE